MPEFIADTDGVVNGMTFADLSDIFQGYVEAMLSTETSAISMVDWADEESQEMRREGTADGSIPADAGWGDIHPETAAEMQMDCFNFEVKARDILNEVYARGAYDAKQAGRDFWFTRNRHGVGFWDRKALEKPDAWASFGSPRVGEPGWAEYIADREDSPGNRLTAIAKEFGETWSDFIPDEASPTGYGYVYLT